MCVVQLRVIAAPEREGHTHTFESVENGVGILPTKFADFLGYAQPDVATIDKFSVRNVQCRRSLRSDTQG